MKLLLLFLLTAGFSLAQTNKSVKIVPLVQDRVYELDGGLIVTSTSRVIIPVELPANTVEWYYMFTSHSDQNAAAGKQVVIDLASQLTRAVDETGLSAGIVSYLLAPTGSSNSNIFLFQDADNARNFVNKTDQSLFPTYWHGNSNYSIKAATQGTQKIDLTTNKKYYIGIQAGNSPVFVKIEIAALVDESIATNNGWTAKNKQLVSDLLVKAFESKDVKPEAAVQLTNCIVESIVRDYSQDVFFGLIEAAINSILEDYMQVCYKQIEGVDQTEESKNATAYGNLGWRYYESGDIEKAIEYSLKALDLQGNLAYVKANLGLFSFIKGDEIKGNDYYIAALSDMKKDRISGKTYLKAAIDDIRAAIKTYPTVKACEPILSELIEEYDSW